MCGKHLSRKDSRQRHITSKHSNATSSGMLNFPESPDPEEEGQENEDGGLDEEGEEEDGAEEEEKDEDRQSGDSDERSVDSDEGSEEDPWEKLRDEAIDKLSSSLAKKLSEYEKTAEQKIFPLYQVILYSQMESCAQRSH